MSNIRGSHYVTTHVNTNINQETIPQNTFKSDASQYVDNRMCFHKVNICHWMYVSCNRTLMSDMLLLILAVNLAVNASVCFAMNMSTGMSQYVSIYVSWHVSECFFGAFRRESFFAFIFQMFAVNECKWDCHHLPSFAIGRLTSGRSSRQDHSLSLWICKATLQTASARGQKKHGDSPSYSWRRSCYQLWGPNFQRDSWHNWQSFWQHPLQHC